MIDVCTGTEVGTHFIQTIVGLQGVEMLCIECERMAKTGTISSPLCGVGAEGRPESRVKDQHVQRLAEKNNLTCAEN